MKKNILLFLVILISISVFSQTKENIEDTTVRKIIVGFKVTPPFIIKNNDSYTGISIDLWHIIARKLNIVYELKEYKQSEMLLLLDDIESSKIDICISPMTVTSDRLARFDFTQPFFSSNLAVAVQGEQKTPIYAFISNLFSFQFFEAISLLFVVIFIFGVFLWLVERKVNKQFHKGFKGIGDGIWWSAVTMTTVGYGDKSPQTPLGRIFAIIWMFTAILIISSITGSIAASLTISKIQSSIQSTEDLKKVSVGSIKGSSSETFLKRHGIKPFNDDFPSVLSGIEALGRSEIGAFVYDEPILRHLILQHDLSDKVFVLPYKLNSDYYSFAVPNTHRKLLNKINPVLIKELENVSWIGIMNKYNVDK